MKELGIILIGDLWTIRNARDSLFSICSPTVRARPFPATPTRRTRSESGHSVGGSDGDAAGEGKPILLRAMSKVFFSGGPSSSRPRSSGESLHASSRSYLQGYLDHKKTPPRRTLQKDHA